MVHPHAVCAEISRGLPQLPVARPGRYGSRAGTLVMTTAIIGTGVLGSVIARLLASGGETVRLSGANQESTRKLAGDIGPAAVVAVDNGDAVEGADAVVLALRFAVLRSVVEELTQPLVDRLVVVPSNPLGTDAQGHVSRAPAGGAILRRDCGQVDAGGGAPGDGLRNPLGRCPRVLQQA